MLQLLLSLTLGAGALSNFPLDAGRPDLAARARRELRRRRRWWWSRPATSSTPSAPTAGTVSGFPFVVPDGELLVGAPAAADLDGDRPPRDRGGDRVRQGLPLERRRRGGGLPGVAAGPGQGRRLLRRRGRGRASWSWWSATSRGGSTPSSATAPRPGASPSRAAGRPSPARSPAAVFAGGPSLAWGTEDGKVHVVSAAGQGRPGFPLVTAFAVTGAPVFADLDDDGRMDLLVGSQDFKLYAVDEKGLALPGFPVAAGYRIYEAPAVADLDGDHRLDVIFASADGFLHAVDRTGKAADGLPGAGRAAPLLRAGGRATSTGTARSRRWWPRPTARWRSVNGAGRSLAGFPASLGESDVAASPLLFDLAGDGDAGHPGRHAARAAARPARRARRHGGRWRSRGPGRGTTPPAAAATAPTRPPTGISSSRPRSRGWPIRCRPPGGPPGSTPGPAEAVPAPRLEWLRNGKPVAGLEGRTRLPPGTARHGERWRFSLAAAGSTLPVESARGPASSTPRPARRWSGCSRPCRSAARRSRR